MLLRKKVTPRAWIMIGFTALVLANLVMRFLHPTGSFSDGMKDGVTGCLYGIAIGALLVGVSRRGERKA